MSLRLGDPAPNFDALTTHGPIRFYEWMEDSWAILFSHPRDFTPVCTTELGAVAKLSHEFARRNVKVIGLSVDTLESHEAWIADIEQTQRAEMNFPMIADEDGDIAEMYEMMDPKTSDTSTVRSVFVIGPDKRIKLTLTYPDSTGRNFVEIIRAVDALQLSERHGVVTPVNWKRGEDVVIAPAMPDDVAAERFPEGWDAVRPYLRITSCPKSRRKKRA